MTLKDRYGQTLTTASPAAADALSDGLDAVLAFDGGVVPALDRAIADDPEFALAHAHRARALQVEGRMPEALASLDRAKSHAGGTSGRERAHIAILATAIEGNGPAALAAIRGHLQEHPRDVFLLAQAVGPFGLIACGGYQDRHEQNLALLESLRNAYGNDWWFISSLAFAYNELNRFGESAQLAHRAYELRQSGNAAHTVAHVHFETGGVDSGVDFLERFLSWHPKDAQIHSHLGWHLALFELARDNPAGANQIMNEKLRPAISHGSPLSMLADGAALIWRQQLLGVEPADGAIDEVASYAATRFGKPAVLETESPSSLAMAALNARSVISRIASWLSENAVVLIFANWSKSSTKCSKNCQLCHGQRRFTSLSW